MSPLNPPHGTNRLLNSTGASVHPRQTKSTVRIVEAESLGAQDQMCKVLPVRLHRLTRKHKCLRCGRCFLTPGYLNRHIAKHTLHSVPRLFHCPWAGCGKTSGRYDNLAHHFRVHLSSRRDRERGMSFVLDVMRASQNSGTQAATSLVPQQPHPAAALNTGLVPPPVLVTARRAWDDMRPRPGQLGGRMIGTPGGEQKETRQREAFSIWRQENEHEERV